MKSRILFLTLLTILVCSTIIYYGFTANDYLQQQQSNGNNLPSNPLKGRIVFEQKGCINCHAINGYGGKIAPDFGTHNFFGNDYDLIAAMWNHSPNMLRKMRKNSIDKEVLSSTDFRNLRYFLQFLRYLGSGGEVSKGQNLFVNMKCIECHSVGEENSKKIRLDSIGVYASPLYLAQVMWNHAVKMQSEQRLSGVKIPVFKDNEFADLSAYIGEVSTYGKHEKVYMSPGDPLKGEKLFFIKKCYSCHVQKRIGPDLKKYNFNKSVAEIAGMMWNHAANMQTAMRAYKVTWPLFKGDEMANLISYLYFENRSTVKGSIGKGEELIKHKNCISCHNSGNNYGAPEITAIGPFHNKDDFFSEIWNHLPMMEKSFYKQGKSLPNLSSSDIKSLYLYFNRRK